MVSHPAPACCIYVNSTIILTCQTSPNVAPPLPADEWQEARASVKYEWKAWAKNAYDFLQSHARGAVYPTPSPKMNVTKFNAQIRFMIGLYFCLSKFVNFYPTFARHNAARTRPVYPTTNNLRQPVQGQEWTRLSDTELLRLQRGLLRYELCCRLVGLPSIAASCNTDVCDELITSSHGSVVDRIWMFNPFSKILPIDEVEEIVCASIYVRDLYDSFRRDLYEPFGNHIVDSSFDQGGGGGGVPEKDDIDTRNTAEYWISQNEGRILDFINVSLQLDRQFDSTECMSRLGLVFLDRMTRSTVAERGELMRCVLNRIQRPDGDCFLWSYWHDIMSLRSAAEGFVLGLGPHCNSMIRISSTNCEITELICIHDAHRRLGHLGWVFFDDESKLRSLGLPHRVRVSDVRDWFEKAENNGWNGFPLPPNMPESAWAAGFTRQEWNDLVVEKYSLKDHRGDYEAMSRFAAGARAVVDFRSTQLPHIG